MTPTIRFTSGKSRGGVRGALPDIALTHEVDDVLRKVGFELMEARDIAADAPPGIPWYQPLVGSGFYHLQLPQFCGRAPAEHGLIWLLERLGVVPRGMTQVSNLLSFAAVTFAEAGRLGIFTPMYFVHARKPE